MESVSRKQQPRQRIERIIGEDEIRKRVTELGAQIARDYAGKEPVLIGVLKGCMVFMADLIRSIDLPLEVEFISAASYRCGSTADDKLTITENFSESPAGKDILIVEGIVETGRTARAICERLQRMEPASLEVVTLLDKPAAHRSQIDVKYRGFSMGNEFVIGYGLDNTQKFRNLPYIGRVIDTGR